VESQNCGSDKRTGDIYRQVEKNSTFSEKQIYDSEPKATNTISETESQNTQSKAMKSEKAKAFLDYVKNSHSKNTEKTYRLSLAKFSEFYTKDLDEVLAMRKQDILSEDYSTVKRFDREIEKFHSWLIEKGYSINTARNLTVGIQQFFKYYGMPITCKPFKTVLTTKDHIPTIEEYRRMFNVGDLRARTIISMALDLGWRIGDFIAVTKDKLPNLNRETPIAFDLVTEKCSVIAKSFLSTETVELLKAYLPTLRAENPFLFQSNTHNHLDTETVGDILKNCAEKAKIEIDKSKRIRFHCFRKRFLSECANLKIDVNTAKILCGKDVEDSMLTYLSEVEHVKAFKELKTVLNMSNGAMRSTLDAKDTQITELRSEVEKLRLAMKGMIEIFGDEIAQKALAKANLNAKANKNLEGVDITSRSGERARSILEVLEDLGRAKEAKDLEEYKRLIENGNGNNGEHT
jgi:integrase